MEMKNTPDWVIQKDLEIMGLESYYRDQAEKREANKNA